MKHRPFIAGIVGAAIVTLFALPIVVSGAVWVPGSMWASGYYRGPVAYLMAAAWLCLAAGLLFAGCMLAFPERYFQHRWRRDLSFVLFGILFVAATGGIVVRAHQGQASSLRFLR